MNSLSTSQYSDIEFLKWQAQLKALNMKLPSSSSKMLENLLNDEKITVSEFVEKFEKIIASTNTLTWKLNLFVYDSFDNLRKFLFQLYWTEILIFSGLFFLVFLLDKKFNIKKPFFWFQKSNQIIFERSLAVLGYLIPYLDICSIFLSDRQGFSSLLTRYPYLRLLLNDSVVSLLRIYENQQYVQFLYLIVVYGVFLRNRWPKSRFVRFNWMCGLMIVLIQSNFNQLYFLILNKTPNQEEQIKLAFIGFFLNAIVLIPCIFRAILGRYPNNRFIRDNIEIHLGRDGPDFKWWDRQ